MCLGERYLFGKKKNGFGGNDRFYVPFGDRERERLFYGEQKIHDKIVIIYGM